MKIIPLLDNNPEDEDIITPEFEYSYCDKVKKSVVYPELCIMFFQKELMTEFKKDLDYEKIDELLEHEVFKVEYNNKNFLVIKSGIGGPLSSLLVERLIVRGVKRFITVGISGSLRPDIEAGRIFLCSKSIRDEGVSYHYQNPSKYSYPSNSLNNLIKEFFNDLSIEYGEGDCWTTDAGYKESKNKALKYRDEGVECIDMESASLFAVAKHRNVDLSSIFIISDYVDEKMNWKPKFHEEKIMNSLLTIKKVLLSIIDKL